MRQRQEGELGCFGQFILGFISLSFLIALVVGGLIQEGTIPNPFTSSQDTVDQLTATATANADATQMALTPTPSTVTVDLPTAVKQQLVKVSFQSTGGASGDVIDISLHRFKSQNSNIQVGLPPGLILTNSDSSEQDMVLLKVGGVLSQPGATGYTPSDGMELTPGETDAYYVVEAYCASLHKGNPGNGTLTLSGQGSPDLVSLMNAALAYAGEIGIIQPAVWAITDNPTRDDLNQVGYGLSDQDLQSVRDLLKLAGLNPANYQLTA